jgi:hypothetical protein
MLGMKTLRPIQLLTDRVRILSDDELPAVKTAAKFLCRNKDYKIYHTNVKRELKRIQDLRQISKKPKDKEKKKIATV